MDQALIYWKKNKYILLLFIGYFFIHLYKLTTLPIFNDEAIYLDWAWGFTHTPGHLYDSLFDAKQPLVLWLFSIFETIIEDPFYAGRFFSVIIGSITALGIYKLTRLLANKNTALVSLLLYSITPLFVFYNRQALMEAAVSCVGVWIALYMIVMLKKQTIASALILGSIMGIGFLIKTTVFLYIIMALLVVGLAVVRTKQYRSLSLFGIAIIVALLFNSIILINPVFWQMLPTNSRYTLTVDALLHFPFAIWMHNLFGFLEISFIFLSPLVFIAGLMGIMRFVKERKDTSYYFIIYSLGSLLLEILLVKSQNQRYLVPFLPFFIICAGYILVQLWNTKVIYKVFVLFIVLVSLMQTVFFITNPYTAIEQFARFTSYSETAYTRGQTSGYGIGEINNFITSVSHQAPLTIVAFANNAGNPENAVDLNFEKNQKVILFRIDATMIPDIDTYQCLSSSVPFYLLTRRDEQAGLNQFLTPVKKILQPNGTYYISLYKLKDNCQGKTLSITEIYSDVIKQQLELKGVYMIGI